MKTLTCKCGEHYQVSDEEALLRDIFGEISGCPKCEGIDSRTYLDFVERNEDANG